MAMFTDHILESPAALAVDGAVPIVTPPSFGGDDSLDHAPYCVCNPGFYGDGMQCLEWTLCEAFEYEVHPPTTTTDAVC
eukprot:SAG11_NODE_38463_length_252_cov_0.679739_1_plen_78_part_01